jgi:hypothetical protein
MTNKTKNLDFAEGQAKVREMSTLKKGFYFICGLESKINENNQEEIEETKMDTSIDENPFWSRFCDINAIAAMSLAGFAVAFFNKYN